MRRTLFLAALAALLTAAWFSPPLLPPASAQQTSTPDQFSCSADNIGATLTLLSASPSGNCTATTDGTTRYVTDIIAQSTTATGGQWILRTGTGTNCGTGTASLFPSAATAARFSAAANGAAPASISLRTPLRLPEGKDLCVLGVGTNTTTIQVLGYVGPK